MATKDHLAEDLWIRLSEDQRLREAQQSERIRQAVTKSDVPLDADPVEAISQLSDEHSRAVLQEHQ